MKMNSESQPEGAQHRVVGYLVEQGSELSVLIINNTAAPASDGSDSDHKPPLDLDESEDHATKSRKDPLLVDVKMENTDDSASEEEEEGVAAGLFAGGAEEVTVECNHSSLMFYKQMEKLRRLNIPCREPSLDRDCDAPAPGEGDLTTEQDSCERLKMEDDGSFSWQEDFDTFSGQEEEFKMAPGPSLLSTCPYKLFTSIWDTEIMEIIVAETNKYAWQTIVDLTETESGISTHSRLHCWVETTVSEMYLFFAITMFMAIDVRFQVDEYWTTGILGMPEFRSLMSRDRFTMLWRFLHFHDNMDRSLSSYNHKLRKIVRIVEHCNRKFQDLYTPSKHLSLDESLLLWKDKLSWVQCFSTKADRIGIKTYELCEAKTGYQLNAIIYAGSNGSGLESSIHGFHQSTAKVVLKLMQRYLDKGHCLVMDNWYNQLPLIRFLKARRTDVIGTLNRGRVHAPHALRTMDERRVPRGTVLGYHCGDVSLVAWKDAELITMVSTYHNKDMVMTRRSGHMVSTPKLVKDYDQYMGGVDLKDQKLSPYPMERKMATKWYLKVFRRLLNVSIMNAHVLQSQNNKKHGRPVVSQRDFRFSLISEILKHHRGLALAMGTQGAGGSPAGRLAPGAHLVVTTQRVRGRLRRHRCACCSARGGRSEITTRCSLCNVALCVDRCFYDFHTVAEL